MRAELEIRLRRCTRSGSEAAVIADHFDDAFFSVKRDNPKLDEKFPREDARSGIVPEKMKGLIAKIGFRGEWSKAHSTLGRVYDPESQ